MNKLAYKQDHHNGHAGHVGYKEPLRAIGQPTDQHHYPPSHAYNTIKTEQPDYLDYSTDNPTSNTAPNTHMVDNMMYSHEGLSRLTSQGHHDQLAKYSTDSLSRLSAGQQEGLSRLANGLPGCTTDAATAAATAAAGLSRLGMTGDSLSRLSQAQDSLARISSMTNSISPPQSSSHSSLSPGKIRFT